MSSRELLSSTERKWRKLGSVVVAAGALAISGCGGERKPPVQTNEDGETIGALLIAEREAAIFAAPNQLDRVVGEIKADQEVIARCYFDSPPDYDDSIFVDAAGTVGTGDGYVYVLSRQGSKDTDPDNVFNYSPEEIKDSLPSCDETAADD